MRQRVLPAMNIMANRLTKKNIFYVFVSLVAILIVVSGILRAITPTPPPSISKIETAKVVSATDIKIDDDLNMQLPSKLNFYRQTNTYDVVSFAQSLAKKLNFRLLTGLKTTWGNDAEDEVLSIEGNLVTYQQYLTPQEANNDLVSLTLDENSATEIMKNFLDKHQILTDYVLTEPKKINITTEGFENSEPYDGYKIEAQININDIPYYLGERSLPPARGYLYNDGKIVKMYFYPTSLNLELISTYNSLAFEKIKTNLTSNTDATYIYYEKAEPFEIVPKQLKEITFSKASLEYRENETNSLIIPYVRFSGVGKNQLNEEYLLEAITPAIEVE